MTRQPGRAVSHYVLLNLLATAFLVLLAPACGGASTSAPPPAPVSGGGGSGVPIPNPGGGTGGGGTDPLQGGVLATFTVGPEQFQAWVTDAPTAQLLVDVQAGTAAMRMVRGTLVAGSGVGAHNGPWNWHLAPPSIRIDPISLGVCAAFPSAAEADAPLFTNVNECLWAVATLVNLVDKR